jgi:hypothetical protein
MISSLAKHTARMMTIQMPRIRRILIAAALTGLAIGAFVAQPKVTLPGGGKPPELTLTTPNQAPPTTEGEVTARVTPGPEPWYTLFTSGEVVGYIEPCG